jgi:tryprostatin B 6-hydroxylase
MKISKWAHVFMNARRNQNCLAIQRLHKKYGPIVRIGPRELSISTPDGIKAVYGSTGMCNKGVWYSSLDVIPGLEFGVSSTRNRAVHNRRKREWDRALNSKASLAAYEPRVMALADKLLAKLDSERVVGQAVSSQFWLSLIAFDAMGEIGWGRSLNEIEDVKQHVFIKQTTEFQKQALLLGQLPWLTRLVMRTPFVLGSIRAMFDDVRGLINQKCGEDGFDVISMIRNSNLNDESTEAGKMTLVRDAQLLIAAGADTVWSTLQNMLYFLITNPSLQRTLQDEIGMALSSSSQFKYDQIKGLPFLEAFLKETLRILPPVPTGMQRESPPEGIVVGDSIHIPGNISLSCPTYTIHRESTYYVRPDEFVPSRWTTEPELIREAGAYIPFSQGTFRCPGAQFGVMEIKIVIVKLMQRFSVRFAEGEDGSDFWKFKDTFGIRMGDVQLVLEERRGN